MKLVLFTIAPTEMVELAQTRNAVENVTMDEMHLTDLDSGENEILECEEELEEYGADSGVEHSM